MTLSPDARAAGADALAIVTGWEQFRVLDLPKPTSIMKQPVIVDLRNIHTPEEMIRHGFAHESIGRASVARRRE
jgi:UDPglucose 6-dehydrogenase